MLSPAALLVSAVATAAIGAGPAVADAAPSTSSAPTLTAITLTAPSSSHCPKHGHHQRCHQARGSDVGQLSDAETAVVGAALVALALAAL